MEPVGVGVQGVSPAPPGARRGICSRGPGALGGCPRPPPPAIRLPPAAEYDNVSIFHVPDVTINKAMIQKGLC